MNNEQRTVGNERRAINIKHRAKGVPRSLKKLSPLTLIIALVLLGSGAVLASIGIGGNIFGGGDSVNLQSGLVGHWKFDGNAKDSSPHGNHGRIFGGAGYGEDRHGNTTGAFGLGGVDDKASAAEFLDQHFLFPGGTTAHLVADAGSATWNQVDLRAKVRFNQWPVASSQHIVGGNSTHRSGIVLTDRRMHLRVLNQDINDRGGASTVSLPDLENQDVWLRWTKDWVTGDVNFYYSLSTINDHAQVNWTKLGETLTWPAGETAASTGGQTLVGRSTSGSSSTLFEGRFYAAAFLRNGGVIANPVFTDWNEWQPPFNSATDRVGRAWSRASGTAGSTSDLGFIVPDEPIAIPQKHKMIQDTSFGLWFKADTLANDAALLTFSAPGGTQDDNILYRIGFDGTNNEQLHYTHQYGAGNSESQVFSTNITAGAWNHIFVTRDGSSSEVKLYLNGAQFGSGFTYTNAPDGGGNSWLTIGQNHKTGSYFTGSIDDVRLYNRVLNDAEVSTLHEVQHPPSEIRVSDLQKDLVGHWGMDGNAKDFTPHRNHGAVNGATPAPDRHGQSGSALDFDGTNDYIDGVNQPDVQTGPNLFTVSGYIDPGNQDSFFITPQSNGLDQFIAYDSANERLRVNLAESANTNVRPRYSTAGSVPLNTWTHWAVVINGSNVKIYINGELDQEYNETNGIAGWDNQWIIGQRGNATFWLLGKLDDIRVYGRELGSSEISQFHDSYRPVVQMSDLQKGLIGHWDMNGHSKDLTPYRNHGSLVNGPTLTSDRHGRANSAYLFNGVDQYINRNSYSEIDYTQSYSMSVWANPGRFTNPDSNCGNQRTYIISQAVSSSSYVSIETSLNNIFRVSHRGSPGTPSVASSGSQAINQWYHLVAVYDKSQNQLNFYVNGTSVGTADTSATTLENPSGSAFRLGFNIHNCTNAYFQGKIDDARLYDRALSDTEVKTLHEIYR